MRIFRHIILSIAALIFLFEAWLWDILTALWRRLAAVPVFRRLAAELTAIAEKLPPYGALGLFIIPVLVIFPFKVGALWLIARGHFIFGGFIFLLAKAVGMGAAAFLFEQTRPKLMTLTWFASLYAWVMQARQWAHRLADPYILPIKQAIKRYKERLQRLFISEKSGLMALLFRVRQRIKRRRDVR